MELVELASSIQKAIQSGRWAPGEPLTTPALSEEFGVSRYAAWDALRLLAADGVVELRPERSAIVVGGHSLASAPERVAAALKRDMEAGELKEGDALPPRREMMTRCTASKVDVGRGYRLLVDEGLVVRRPGTLTPVVGSGVPRESDLARVAALMLDMIDGMQMGTALPSAEAMAERFGAGPKTVEAVRAKLGKQGVLETVRNRIKGETKVVVADRSRASLPDLLATAKDKAADLLRPWVEEAVASGSLPALHVLAEAHDVPAKAVWTILAQLIDHEAVQLNYGHKAATAGGEAAIKTLVQLTAEALAHDITVDERWAVGESLPALDVLATHYRVNEVHMQAAVSIVAVRGILKLRANGRPPHVVGKSVTRRATRETLPDVIRQIVAGWEPGAPLPSQPAIAHVLGVTVSQVQKAVKKLVQDGPLISGGRAHPTLIAGTPPRSES
jgi:DNA-binding GntR family transcriptional regulator